LKKRPLERAEEKEREREGDRDQRGHKSHWNNWEDNEKAALSRGHNCSDPSDMTEGRRVLRRCLGQKLADHCVVCGDMQEKTL